MSEKFNYVVGRPRDLDNDSSILAWHDGVGQVRYGTLTEAEAFCQYCNERLIPRERANPYHIYKLIEIRE